ncbi:hypothetical protein HU200_053735 [Digitaria exilis]|uniref:Polycomb protein SUZ12-like zinc finger domain-containing protein n=1 Tax=Digitaria exilis TaxID=1010633 RepID=A0A835ANQ4_9POAL|nr:hypothetical protein HU200_053735 [Digitaria exilis]
MTCIELFKGLQYHLLTSHDLFNFVFWMTEKGQGVAVSLKRNTNQDFPARVDPRKRTFSYFSKYKKRQRIVAAAEAIILSKATELIILSKATDMMIPMNTTEMMVSTKAIGMIVPPKETETFDLTKSIETTKQGHLSAGMGSKPPMYTHLSFEDSSVK